MKITTPDNFSFKNTIYSHGWSELSPFMIDEENWILTYVLDDRSFSNPIAVRFSTGFSTGEKFIKLQCEKNNLSEAEKLIIKQKARHILRLDEDFSEFYEITKNDKNFTWMQEMKIGRLMRSPTVFEDLIKTICTTNCSWGLTKTMVKNVVEKLGKNSNTGEKAFPRPEDLVKIDEKFFREKVRAGYRSPYFVELADSIANGELDPESWLNSDLPTNELKKEMKKVKGVGDYAAENLLKLVGRYDGLALDSFLRSEFYKKHNNGIKCSDKEIKQYYEKFEKFRGLAIWFDLTKRWFD